MKLSAVAICLMALTLSACTTVPADYAASLSVQDKKFRSPACSKMRADAATYAARERDLYWSAGALIGPYGLAIVAAGKEHQEKQRRQFVREMHLKCSSAPLPPDLARRDARNPDARKP